MFSTWRNDLNEELLDRKGDHTTVSLTSNLKFEHFIHNHLMEQLSLNGLLIKNNSWKCLKMQREHFVFFTL